MNVDRRYDARLRKLNRFLALLLRHRSARFPIAIDEEGYADIAVVMHILKGLPNFRWATRADIDAALDLSEHNRFEIAGSRIRAM
ncbi:MAG TPA: RNA 2'-phosphotransferase [Anaerolineae bacterium]|nr:RNA 2'-phosphotransferase [Anaerolineae bacterium]HQI83488.1 RNA 2'-phosphotransferase [Anaerolineae bacterium]